MFFRDLLTLNKDWQDSTNLIVISQSDTEAVTMRCKVARSIFGERQVLWFKDDVVMLM